MVLIFLFSILFPTIEIIEKTINQIVEQLFPKPSIPTDTVVHFEMFANWTNTLSTVEIILKKKHMKYSL